MLEWTRSTTKPPKSVKQKGSVSSVSNVSSISNNRNLSLTQSSAASDSSSRSSNCSHELWTYQGVEWLMTHDSYWPCWSSCLVTACAYINLFESIFLFLLLFTVTDKVLPASSIPIHPSKVSVKQISTIQQPLYFSNQDMTFYFMSVDGMFVADLHHLAS